MVPSKFRIYTLNSTAFPFITSDLEAVEETTKMKRLLVTLVTLLTLQGHFVALLGVEETDEMVADSLHSLRRTESNGKVWKRSSIVSSRSIKSKNNFVPVQKINGTNLYTGIYYRMGMKTFPQGWVTWTNKSNYIQVELNPSELPKYVPGREYQFDNQWTFGLSESGIGYTLTNRGKPYGYLIWVNAEVGIGNHVSVKDDPESRPKMLAGGEWRNDALWIPQGTDEDYYYKLENLAKRENFLTWTWTKHNDFNYYIQMASDEEDDSKFSFDPATVKLESRVFDFRFLHSLEELMEDEKNQSTHLVAIKRFPNYSAAEITSTLEESIEIKDQFTISFKESLAMMHKTSVSLDFLVAFGTTEFKFQGGIEANQEKSTEIKKTVKLKTEIKIPPYTDIEASIHNVWAHNIEMPFTAKMEIIGLTERILVNRPNEVKEGYVPAEIVEDCINSSGGSNMEILSRFREIFTVSVSGTIKGNVALKSVVSTAEISRLRAAI